MVAFVAGGVILLFGLRVLIAGSKLGGEDGKLWEVGVSLGFWAVLGFLGMCMWEKVEFVGMEFLWQWLGLVGVGALVACESMLEELRDEMKERGAWKVAVSVEWVLRVMVWCAGLAWLWWMME